MDALRKELTKIKTLLGNKNQQTIRVVDRFLDDPNFNDITALRQALNSARTVQAGPRAGRTIPELNRSIAGVNKEQPSITI